MTSPAKKARVSIRRVYRALSGGRGACDPKVADSNPPPLYDKSLHLQGVVVLWVQTTRFKRPWGKCWGTLASGRAAP